MSSNTKTTELASSEFSRTVNEIKEETKNIVNSNHSKIVP